MECYSEQMCVIFADGELAVDEARRLRDHLATCQRCRELVDALRAENRVLGESLHELPEEAADPVGFPRLRLSRVWGDLAALAAVLALVSVFSAWVDKLRIPEALEWLNPFSADGLTNLIFNLSYYFAHGGTAMLADYAAVVGGLFLLLGGGALLLGRRWRLQQSGLRLLIVLLTMSLPSFALERRHGEFVTVAANETVDDTLLAAGNNVRMEGVVNGDLLVFARTLEVRGTVKGAEVSGSVGRDLTMAGGSLTLPSTARVGGNLTARVRHLKNVEIADGATIAGKRDIQVRVRKSQFTRPRFYFYQAIWLAAAMLVGWLGLVLVPGFFEACTQAVGSGWRSFGLGFGTLVVVPVTIIVAAITLVGIPVSFMLLAMYLTAIYLAKIWVGAFLGRALLKPAKVTKRDSLLGLLVGLLILGIVGFVPYLGGLIRLVVLCLGLGAFSWQLYRSSRLAITT